MERFTFHSMRYTFGTLAARQWQLQDVQFYMGHADIQTTMIYVHARPRTGAAGDLGDLITAELGEEQRTLNPSDDVVPNVVPNPAILRATQSNSA
jgi:Phage integrase family